MITAVDQVTRLAPLGIRFWDPVASVPIRDGLQVTLFPADQPWRRASARPNPSGVYVLHDGPGLGRAIRGTGDETYWAHPPEVRSYRCEVTDPQARFHPVAFDARLPARQLFQPECALQSPPSSRAIHLFSTPTRPMPGAMAVIRAELARADTGKPAAWAMVAAAYRGSVLGRGIADGSGRIALAFSYPEPERHARPSPPESGAPPGQDGTLMRWNVHLRVFYAQLEANAIPDYCAILQQREGILLEEQSPPRELEQTTVWLGRAFVYPTPGGSRLFVAPA